MNSHNDDLQLDAGAVLRTVVIVCVCVEFLLFTLDYHLNLGRGVDLAAARRLFSTTNEDGLASLFAVLQTALIAISTWAIWAVVRQRGSAWTARGWALIAGFFTYLAIDDGAFVHEIVGTWSDMALRTTAIGSRVLEVFPSYRWQLVFMPVFACMGLFIFVFLLRQLRGWQPKATVLFALGCLATAVFIDFFEGLQPDHPLNPYTAIASTWHLDYWTARSFGETPYGTLLHLSKSFEECLEMFAMTLLLVVFLQHLARVADGLRLRCGEISFVPAARAVPSGGQGATTTCCGMPRGACVCDHSRASRWPQVGSIATDASA
jgi:hypothetical protein